MEHATQIANMRPCVDVINSFDRVMFSNDLVGMRALFEKGLRPTDLGVTLAQSEGSIDMIKLIREYMPDAISPLTIYSGATIAGDLTRMKWIYQEYPKSLQMTGSTMAFAASGGKLHTIRWAHETFGDMVVLRDIIWTIENACRNSHLSLLMWLKERYAHREFEIDPFKWDVDQPEYDIVLFLASESLLDSRQQDAYALMEVLDTLFIQCELVPLGEPRMNLG